MARKDRVPNPPKRVQAPQRRSTPSTSADADRRRKLIFASVASALVVIAVVLGIILFTGGDDGSDGVAEVRAALTAAGCTLQSAPAQPGDHTAAIDATTDPKWNTDPPTSGPHFGTPAIFDMYDSPVNIAQAVHNLEHGGIFIFYGDEVPAETVTQIEGFYNEDRTALLVAPLPELGDKIALGAWVTPDPRPGSVGEGGQGHLAECTEFDEEAFAAFRDNFRFRGPERFPPEQLEPGL
ncbi:MAG TPA: DUF3105 domain-containing protein [Gaiellaceae bacterium]|nr:DUF3105 domain-containing protein [Gaiellaceae bacterium]